MKIAITGHQGFIGSHLVKRLPQAILVDDILQEIPESDVIIHLAALPSVTNSITHPYESFEINVLGTLNVLEACRRNGTKIIFPSSSQSSPDAINPYALQKHHCEELIRLYSRLYHIKYCILKLYNVFGPGERGVIGVFQRTAAEGKPLEVWGGHQRRDFVHIDTVVDKLIEGIDNEGTFEVGSGNILTIQEVADMISPNQIPMPLPEGQPMETRCPTPVPTLSVKEYLHG